MIFGPLISGNRFGASPDLIRSRAFNNGSRRVLSFHWFCSRKASSAAFTWASAFCCAIEAALSASRTASEASMISLGAESCWGRSKGKPAPRRHIHRQSAHGSPGIFTRCCGNASVISIARLACCPVAGFIKVLLWSG